MPTLLAPPPDVADDLTRRELIIGAAAAGLLTLAACGSDDRDRPGTAGPADAGWRFTDDRGAEVVVASAPRRIVAYETAAAALSHLGIRPVGVFGGQPLADNPNLVGVELAGIDSVGEVYGELNLEKLAALRPDLVVTAYDPRQDGPVFGFTEQSVMDRVEAIAPIVALNGIKDPVEVIGRFEDLAEALSADLDAPQVAGARRRFETASNELRAAIAAKPGLRALATYATPADGMTVWRPARAPGLRQLQALGLDLVSPGGETVASPAEDFAKFFGEQLSMEQAAKYQVDLILFDSRLGQSGLDQLAKVATWAALPAVRANQVVFFRALENWSYHA